MPSIPSTCVPVNALDSVVLPDNGLLSVDELISGPTPDPDTDDVVLVQPDDGMVFQVCTSRSDALHTRTDCLNP